MTATSWNPVSWQPNEVVTDEKMQQLSDNIQWLKDNTPRSTYARADGLKRNNGVVLLGGVALITPRAADIAVVRVQFGQTFATGCEPVMTTGLVNNYQTQIFIRLRGIGRPKPDHNGFEAEVRVAADSKSRDKLSQNTYVHYMALGYK